MRENNDNYDKHFYEYPTHNTFVYENPYQLPAKYETYIREDEPEHKIKKPLSYYSQEGVDIPPSQPIRRPLSYHSQEGLDIPPSQPIRRPLSYHVAENTNI